MGEPKLGNIYLARPKVGDAASEPARWMLLDVEDELAAHALVAGQVAVEVVRDRVAKIDRR